MTIAHLCVLVACLIPILCAGIAKAGAFGRPVDQGGYDNRDPRGWLSRQSGHRARANAAQANSFEALPLFVAAVLTSWQLGVRHGSVDMLAVAFVAIRLTYVWAYVKDKDLLRTAAWMAGYLACIAIFLSPWWAR